MDKITTKDMANIIDTMADIIIENEVHFCKMDSAAGDGDFGMSLAKGFKQLKKEWNDLDFDDIGSFLKSCSMVIMEYCGGASGPIWGSGFRGAAKAVKGVEEIGLSELAIMLQGAVESIQKTGERSFGVGAKVGDKTLIDALAPAADSLTESAKDGEELLPAMKKAAEAAVAGAEKTKDFAARLGRAGTVGDRSLGHPDAGAYGLGVIFTGIVDKLMA